MRERPILFSAPMVRAILNGTKTQTRRIVKPQPSGGWSPETPPVFGRITSPHPRRGKFGVFVRRGVDTDFPETDLVPCPYGQPGDRMWVKETWFTAENLDGVKPTDLIDDVRINFAADLREDDVILGRLRPSIFMRRWMSRITLEIVNVRVERLNEIGESDAKAEGAMFFDGRPINHHGWRHDPEHGFVWDTARASFACLWNRINGEGSWAANPWVWVIEFRRLDNAI